MSGCTLRHETHSINHPLFASFFGAQGGDALSADAPVVGGHLVNHHESGVAWLIQHPLQQRGGSLDQHALLRGADPFVGHFNVDVWHGVFPRFHQTPAVVPPSTASAAPVTKWASVRYSTASADLARHDCIQYALPSTGRKTAWTFKIQGENSKVDTAGRWLCQEDYLATLTLVKSGVGLMQVYRFTVEQELSNGALVEVLKDYAGASRPFILLYPYARFVPLKVRKFIDFLTEA